MSGFPPTLAALLLILGAALLSALAVGAMAKSPPISALTIPAVTAAARASPTLPARVVAGPLDGLPTEQSRAARRPIVAMLDNFAAARPQSGLGEASVVWEAPVEGGITRLMAVFLEHDASRIGPIRSTRPYFLDWAAAYHPLFVHDGGSPAAQAEVNRISGLVNIDAVSFGTTFRRVSSEVAPHNLFSSTPAIRTLTGLHNWGSGEAVPAIPHRQNSQPAANPTGKRVTADFSLPGVAPNPSYAVSYRFDPASDTYLRSVAGQPAVDSLTGRQIEANNVVLLVTAMKLIPNDPLSRITVRTLGAGKAVVLEGGRETQGTWRKRSPTAALHLTDGSGSSLRLDPGATWIEVVTAGSYRVK